MSIARSSQDLGSKRFLRKPEVKLSEIVIEDFATSCQVFPSREYCTLKSRGPVLLPFCLELNLRFLYPSVAIVICQYFLPEPLSQESECAAYVPLPPAPRVKKCGGPNTAPIKSIIPLPLSAVYLLIAGGLLPADMRFDSFSKVQLISIKSSSDGLIPFPTVQFA